MLAFFTKLISAAVLVAVLFGGVVVYWYVGSYEGQLRQCQNELRHYAAIYDRVNGRPITKRVQEQFERECAERILAKRWGFEL